MTKPSVRLKWTVVAVSTAGILLLAGCGDSDPPSAAGGAPSSAGAPVDPTTVTQAGSVSTTAALPAAANSAVAVKQFQFMPGELVVAAGTAVTWTNEDDILHTATSGATPGTPDGQFDGPMDGRGKSFSHTFSQPGRFAYFCNRHNSMTGTVVVQ